ncbi:hypothetical protein [Cognatiyoonia sp. IB215182]|uniref:hypothetical protein n=1 Tax=Cognatiyoonia sp. IB215182 TaxID=3097353 RepID=UPI002A23AB10|nr:hypothetical protein [Cognatiyoonia sp. IB215182]
MTDIAANSIDGAMLATCPLYFVMRPPTRKSGDITDLFLIFFAVALGGNAHRRRRRVVANLGKKRKKSCLAKKVCMYRLGAFVLFGARG